MSKETWFPNTRTKLSLAYSPAHAPSPDFVAISASPLIQQAGPGCIHASTGPGVRRIRLANPLSASREPGVCRPDKSIAKLKCPIPIFDESDESVLDAFVITARA